MCKAVYRNFPDTDILDSFFDRITPRKNDGLSKLLSKGSKNLCNSEDIFMIAKEE